MKKVFLVFILIFCVQKTYSYELTRIEQEKIDNLVNIINNYPKTYVKNKFEYFCELKNNFNKDSKNYSIIENIIAAMVGRDGTLLKNTNLVVINNDISNLVLKSTFSKSEIDKLIQNSIDTIKNNDNIFIFRSGDNISLDIMRYTNTKILEINQNMRIFVDQEGGLVNRYNIFDSQNTINYYLSDINGINIRYQKLSKELQEQFKKSISGRSTFISAKKVGELYINAQENDKENLLDFISYFQLFITKDSLINTYGLVLDLDYGNPAISGNERSFSKNMNDMIKYGNYFVKNSEELGIFLYLKHYPGHGAGKIDTHSGILEYTLKDKDYLGSNLWVFESVIKNSKDNYSGNIGLMVGHIMIPNDYKSRFLGNIGEVSVIITDDLGMNAYKLAKDKVVQGYFFSTNEIIDNKKTIKLSTTINQIK